MRKGIFARRSRPAFRATHRPGFTLIETTLALLIVGVMAGVAMPRLTGAVSESRADGAAAVVASDLELAMSLAVRQGTPVRIAFDASSGTYRFTDRGTGAVLHTRRMGPDTEYPISQISFSESTVDVFPRRVVSRPLRVTLTAGEASTEVELLAGGLIRVVGP